MNDDIRYGIAGCGYAGGIHGENLKELPGARLTAVWDVDGERARQFGERFGAFPAESLDQLCGHPEIDVLIITTPNNSHVLPALAGAKKGKHIFCEKPVALSLSDTERMLLAARENQVHFFAAHTTNFIRGVQTAKDLVRQGRIGRLLAVEAVHTDWAGPQREVGWKQKKAISGGHLYHHMHEAELICQLAGLPETVYALGRNLAHSGPGFGDEEDVMMLLMEIPAWRSPLVSAEERPGRASSGERPWKVSSEEWSGKASAGERPGRAPSGEWSGKASTVLASLTIGSAFHQGEHVVKIQGEKGGIRLDFKESCVLAEMMGDDGRMVSERFLLQETEEEDKERREGYRRNRLDAGKGFGKPGMETSRWMKTIFRKELGCFHQLLLTGEIPPEYASLADGTAAVRCMKLLDGAMESIRREGPVRLESEGLSVCGFLGNVQGSFRTGETDGFADSAGMAGRMER